MASSSIEDKGKPQNWLLRVWSLECCSIEGFREVLAGEPPEHLDSQGWERTKRNCLFGAIEGKNVDLVSVLVEQPGFDVNAKFDCRCGGQCATCEGKSGLKSETPCLSEICMAQASPLHVSISLSGSYHLLFLSQFCQSPVWM